MNLQRRGTLAMIVHDIRVYKSRDLLNSALFGQTTSYWLMERAVNDSKVNRTPLKHVQRHILRRLIRLASRTNQLEETPVFEISDPSRDLRKFSSDHAHSLPPRVSRFNRFMGQLHEGSLVLIQLCASLWDRYPDV